MASTRPKSERLFSEKPNTCMTASVPMSDTGTASSGMMEARQLCRKRMTTKTTSSTASTSVVSTDRIEARTNLVVS